MIVGALVTALATFGLLALVFTPLERAFAAGAHRPWGAPSWREDLCFFAGQYFLWSTLAVAVLGAVHDGASLVVPAGLREAAARQPVVVQVVGAIVAGDMCVYWFHRACHRFDPLWRLHAVHHSVEHLDWLAAHREHPLDGLFTQLLQNLPALLLGVPLGVVAPLAIFRGAWGIFIHANVRAPLGPLGILLGAPELHRWHHARLDRTAHNFANLAPWLDVVFGTYHLPAEGETYELGLTEASPRGYLAQLVRPFTRA